VDDEYRHPNRHFYKKNCTVDKKKRPKDRFLCKIYIFLQSNSTWKPLQRRISVAPAGMKAGIVGPWKHTLRHVAMHPSNDKKQN
jgi:hypothetical protein